MSRRDARRCMPAGRAGARGQPESAAVRQAKLLEVPPRLRRMYREAVTSRRRAAAIRFHCLECVGWVAKEVRLCNSPGCVLYPYRLGGYPGNVDPQGSEAADPSQAGRQPAESPIGEGGAVPPRPPRAPAAARVRDQSTETTALHAAPIVERAPNDDGEFDSTVVGATAASRRGRRLEREGGGSA